MLLDLASTLGVIDHLSVKMLLVDGGLGVDGAPVTRK